MGTLRRFRRYLVFLSTGILIFSLLINQFCTVDDTGPSNILNNIDTSSYSNESSPVALDFIRPSLGRRSGRPKACLYSLARNSELEAMLLTIRTFQMHFNDKYHYDWVLLNDVPFSEEFMNAVRLELGDSANVKFGTIPREHWSYPEFVDQEKCRKVREEMKNVIYGGAESYRHMCRFQSGFFWRNPLVMEYDWYWKVEPGVILYCDVNYDVFQYMQDNNLTYGFGISLIEEVKTIPTLWNTTMDFFRLHPEYLAEDNLMNFLSNDNGTTYTLCHFWGNFEIANFNIWRSPAFRAYFDYLDNAGGFFYERWGDAPVRSIGVSLLLPKNTTHFFSDMGYLHSPGVQCPIDLNVWRENRCECLRKDSVTFKGKSCGRKYYEAMGIEMPPNWRRFADSHHLGEKDIF